MRRWGRASGSTDRTFVSIGGRQLPSDHVRTQAGSPELPAWSLSAAHVTPLMSEYDATIEALSHSNRQAQA